MQKNQVKQLKSKIFNTKEIALKKIVSTSKQNPKFSIPPCFWIQKITIRVHAHNFEYVPFYYIKFSEANKYIGTHFIRDNQIGIISMYLMKNLDVTNVKKMLKSQNGYMIMCPGYYKICNIGGELSIITYNYNEQFLTVYSEIDKLQLGIDVTLTVLVDYEKPCINVGYYAYMHLVCQYGGKNIVFVTDSCRYMTISVNSDADVQQIIIDNTKFSVLTSCIFPNETVFWLKNDNYKSNKYSEYKVIGKLIKRITLKYCAMTNYK